MALLIGLLLTTTPALMALSMPTGSTPVVVATDADEDTQDVPSGTEVPDGEDGPNSEEVADAAPVRNGGETPNVEKRPEPMTLQEASEDEARMQAPGCHARFEDVDVPEDCVHGSPVGDVTVVLVGDSHGQHWLPALDEAGRARGWRVLAWTKSSCTPIDVTFENHRLEREYWECDEWRQSVVDSLEAMGTVDLIIIADSARYGGALRVDGEPIPQTDWGEVWHEGAVRTFADYEGFTSNVVVLRDTPWAGRNIPECISKDPSDPDRCSFELEGQAWLDEEWVAAELATGGELVTAVDMTEWVCQRDPCRVVTSDGLIKYRDSHHLTATFARTLAGPLSEALQAVLNRS